MAERGDPEQKTAELTDRASCLEAGVGERFEQYLRGEPFSSCAGAAGQPKAYTLAKVASDYADDVETTLTHVLRIFTAPGQLPEIQG